MNTRRRIERLENNMPKPPTDEWPPVYQKGGLDFSSREEAILDFLGWLEQVMTDPRADEKLRKDHRQAIEQIQQANRSWIFSGFNSQDQLKKGNQRK